MNGIPDSTNKMCDYGEKAGSIPALGANDDEFINEVNMTQDAISQLPKLLPETVQMYCKQQKWKKWKFYNTYNRVKPKTPKQFEHIENILKLEAQNVQARAELAKKHNENIHTLLSDIGKVQESPIETD